jgi:hypothetical protein
MMAKKSKRWAAVDRRSGESASSWSRRNQKHHASQWMQDKINRGEWLDPADYARTTGRTGKALSTTDELWAAIQREKAAVPVATPPPPAMPTPASPTPAVPTPAMDFSSVAAGISGMAASYGGDFAHGGGFAAAQVLVAELVTKGTAFDPIEAAKLAAASALEGGIRSVATRGAEDVLTHGLKKLGVELTEEVARATVTQGGKQVLTQVARQAGQRTAAQVFRSAVRSNAIGQAAVLVVEQSVDTYRLASGQIDGPEYGKRSAENVGGAAGGLAGAAAGAVIGSAFPVVGTAIGGVIGGILGSIGATSVLRGLLR